MRNCSAGMEMNMSLSSSGTFKSSRTYSIRQSPHCHIQKTEKDKNEEIKDALSQQMYLESTIYISTTHQEGASSFFTIKKYV